MTSRAAGGAVVFELCVVAAAAVVATRRLGSRAAMVGGLVLLLPSAWLLIAAQALWCYKAWRPAPTIHPTQGESPRAPWAPWYGRT